MTPARVESSAVPSEPPPRPFLADLHVHVARACGRPVKIAASSRLTVAGIVAECVERKGLDAVGIVDGHSSPVLWELEGYVKAGELVALPGGGLARPGDRPLLLILASEVEAEEAGIGPVHFVCYLPDLETAGAFSAFLEPRVTNVTLSSQRARTTGEELARWVRREGGFLVPAHVFTPYKGLFGQGGTDLGQSFSDEALEAVPAVELGLSADTELADLVPSLERFTYLTNSDAHSPETIAREHNALDLVPVGRTGETADFTTLADAIREGRVVANYGLDPRLGKYHRAFCPKCGFTSADEPVGGTCPACGKAGLVGGVLDRILQLSRQARRETAGGGGDRRERARPRPPYVHQIPLRYVPGVGPSALRRLLHAFGTELRVLHEVPEEDLAAAVGPRLAARIVAARGGTGGLEIAPGAGGRYGRLKPPE